MILDNNLSFFYVLILFLVIGAIIFIVLIQPRLNQRKVKNKNEYGSSKFATKKEIAKTFKKENIYNIKEAGFPVYFEKKNNQFESVYFDNVSPHWLLIGSTGSGKSATVVLSECIMFATAKEKESLIITDPKGEIFSKTSSIFKDNGYENIITIDFRNPHLSTHINIMQPIIDEWKIHCVYEENLFYSVCYLFHILQIDFEQIIVNEQYKNDIKVTYKLDDYIIEYILNNIDAIKDKLESEDFFDLLKEKVDYKYKTINNSELLNHIKKYQNQSSSSQAEATRLINNLADLIFAEKETKDPFWLNSSKNLFKGIAGIFLEDYESGLIPENKINVSSIKKFQNSSLLKENQIYLQRNLNTRDYGTISKDYLTSILSASENTYKSITAVFGEKMQIFDDLNVENITSSSDFEISSLVDKPSVLYIIVPDEDKSYYQLVTIIVGILYKELTKIANMPHNNGKLPRKIEWILDEFANCPPLSDIETIVSVARSRNMRFQFFIQSFAQLDQVYGKESSSIIQDNSALTYLKTNSIDCADVISRKLGKSTIETQSISQSTDTFKVGANKTTSLLGRELLTANEIIVLKYKTIIFPTVSNPIFRDTYLYSDIFKNYNFNPITRQIKMIKKNTQNYYTVEQMRSNYENLFNNEMQKTYSQEDNPDTEKEQLQSFINILQDTIRCDKTTITNNNYIIEIDRKINLFEQNKILDLITPYVVVDMIISNKESKTILKISEEVDYYK